MLNTNSSANVSELFSSISMLSRSRLRVAKMIHKALTYHYIYEVIIIFLTNNQLYTGKSVSEPGMCNTF